ncbi:ABC transporter permease [Anaerolineales bacterium HSG6]|nr:ABC transporter permease [Anaerolineales bacterium HSG6]MDM8529980.1 ABC transporter permease [Anaerolineales bacterium HSG25]
MGQYIIRRVFLAIPVIFGIMLMTFVLARVIPGDPCRAVLGERATDEICDAFFERHGLDQPIPVQFGVYIKQILLEGDFGNSLRFNRPVTEIMVERLPVTLELALSALAFATFFGLIFGIVSAYWHNSAIDVGTMMGANIGVSMPVFWLGLMLQYLFALKLKGTIFQLPPSGRLSSGLDNPPFFEVWGWDLNEGTLFFTFCLFLSNLNLFNSIITANWEVFWDAAQHLVLPTIAVGTIPLAIIARITRSSLLEVLSLDYIRTARAKGVSETLMVFRHALSNSLLPVVTIVGLQLGILVSGAVLTETIFNLAGLGRTLYEAITARDYIIIQGMTLVVAVVFVFVNLIVDVSYAFLDPRIRLS